MSLDTTQYKIYVPLIFRYQKQGIPTLILGPLKWWSPEVVRPPLLRRIGRNWTSVWWASRRANIALVSFGFAGQVPSPNLGRNWPLGPKSMKYTPSSVDDSWSVGPRPRRQIACDKLCEVGKHRVSLPLCRRQQDRRSSSAHHQRSSLSGQRWQQL